MSFLLRATLVIGALSYFASIRDRPVDGGPPDVAVTASTLATAWETLPNEVRERAVQDAAAEIGRRVSQPLAASRDTLADADRRPAWRGIAAR